MNLTMLKRKLYTQFVSDTHDLTLYSYRLPNGGTTRLFQVVKMKSSFYLSDYCFVDVLCTYSCIDFQAR